MNTTRRNKDGKQNLTDLRKLLADRDDLNVYRFGGNWKIGRFSKNCWHETSCHYSVDERGAIQIALYGSEEASYEIEFAKHRASQ